MPGLAALHSIELQDLLAFQVAAEQAGATSLLRWQPGPQSSRLASERLLLWQQWGGGVQGVSFRDGLGALLLLVLLPSRAGLSVPRSFPLGLLYEAFQNCC